MSLLNDWYATILDNNPDNMDCFRSLADMGEWFRAIHANNKLAVYDGPDGYTTSPLRAYRQGAISPTA